MRAELRKAYVCAGCDVVFRRGGTSHRYHSAECRNKNTAVICVNCGEPYRCVVPWQRNCSNICEKQNQLAISTGIPVNKWTKCAHCGDPYPERWFPSQGLPRLLRVGHCNRCSSRRGYWLEDVPSCGEDQEDETSKMADLIERQTAWVASHVVDVEVRRKATYRKQQVSREAASFCSGMRRAMAD
jgi:hypothetical protein